MIFFSRKNNSLKSNQNNKKNNESYQNVPELVTTVEYQNQPYQYSHELGFIIMVVIITLIIISILVYIRIKKKRRNTNQIQEALNQNNGIDEYNILNNTQNSNIP